MLKTLLLWNEKFGFWLIEEGDGFNLLAEDEAEGYVDYFMIYEVTESSPNGGFYFNNFETDFAAQCMLEQYVSDFRSNKEIVEYVRKTGFIPDVEYDIYEYRGNA